MHKLIALLFSLCLVYCLDAQTDVKAITGTVTDNETGARIADISVYINNSTFGTRTDNNGVFKLSGIPFKVAEVSFSAVNYETIVLNIDIEKQTEPLRVKMRKKVAILDEVIVSSIDKDGWAKYGDVFLKDFIGYSAFAKQCQLVNHKVLKFSYNKKDNTLRAFATNPLKIKNKALGYELTYWLEDYEHQFSQKLLLFKGYTQFKEMKGGKSKN